MRVDSPTRRLALASLGAGVAGLLPWPTWLQAAAEQLPAFSFVVVSDTHLGLGGNDSAARQWQRTAEEIDAAPGDFVLHLGDVVDGGREAQYPAYKETRKAIGKPVHEIPGNHDRPEAFERHIRKPVDTSFDHQGVRFLLLNITAARKFLAEAWAIRFWPSLFQLVSVNLSEELSCRRNNCRRCSRRGSSATPAGACRRPGRSGAPSGW